MPTVEKIIAKRVAKAIYDFKMIEEGDKILVAVSGGKDSLTLLHDLVRRQRSFPIKYELVAAHIQTDFCTCCKKGEIERTMQSFGVENHIVEVPILGRLKPGRKMNCYWCSTQRRMELLKLADSLGCNKVALGHHMDDIVETFFMNICYKSEVATMLPVMEYRKFAQTVIRPLALVKEADIIKFAQTRGFSSLVCRCPYGRNSKRLEIRGMIKELAKTNVSVRENIFKAMANVKMEYLLTPDEA